MMAIDIVGHHKPFFFLLPVRNGRVSKKLDRSSVGAIGMLSNTGL